MQFVEGTPEKYTGKDLPEFETKLDLKVVKQPADDLYIVQIDGEDYPKSSPAADLVQPSCGQTDRGAGKQENASPRLEQKLPTKSTIEHR